MTSDEEVGRAYKEVESLTQAVAQLNTSLKRFAEMVSVFVDNPLNAEAVDLLSKAHDPREDFKKIREAYDRLREARQVLSDVRPSPPGFTRI